MKKDSTLKIRISELLEGKAKIKAETMGMNLSEYIRYLIMKDLERV